MPTATTMRESDKSQDSKAPRNFRFSHMSDCHLGIWSRHPELSELALEAFEKAVSISIEKNVDFVLICGDLFDSSMPGIDIIRFAVTQIKRLVDAGIRVYSIAGSHDFSPTGKTMLNVFDDVGILSNVHMKTVKDKTGAIITGVEGRRGGLEKELYASVNATTDDNTFKILMFHSAITEYGSPAMESMPLSNIPRGFDYYAAGHVHIRLDSQEKFGRIVYPGPIFPADFSELEKINHGSFCIVDVDNKEISVESIPLRMADVEKIEISGEGKDPKKVENEFISAIESSVIAGKILLLKSAGRLKSGRPSDVDSKRIEAAAKSKGVLTVKKSFHLELPEQIEIKKPSSLTIDGIERELASQVVGKAGMTPCKEIDLIMELMSLLSVEKSDGESSQNYISRIMAGASKILGIDLG